MELTENDLKDLRRDDVLIISDLVDSYGDEKTLPEMMNLLTKFFIRNITPAHYVYLGWLMGQRFTARSIVDRYLNNLKPCQRQN